MHKGPFLPNEGDYVLFKVGTMGTTAVARVAQRGNQTLLLNRSHGVLVRWWVQEEHTSLSVCPGGSQCLQKLHRKFRILLCISV